MSSSTGANNYGDPRDDAERELDELRRERDHYRKQVHDLTERIRNMTSAASGAAASTVIAIERIQEMDKVVKAAERWRDQVGMAATDADVALWRAVDDWRIKRSGAS